MLRVLFLNRSYYPDAEATGQLLTELCEDLSSEMSVSVIAGQPNSNPAGARFRRLGSEVINQVTVHRVWHTRFSKGSRLGRACNLITFTLSAALAGLFGKRPDVVVTETDPPMLCLIGWLLSARFRCRFVAYLQDIHPELGFALRKMRRTPVTKFLQRLFHAAYRRADRIIVLSADMRRYLQRIGVKPARIKVISNWVDTHRIRPVKEQNRFRQQWNTGNRFLVMYSGNLGVCQDLTTILSAAELLRSHGHVQFLLIGNGVSKKSLVEQVADRQLDSVRFDDYQPLSQLHESLSAADLHLVPVEGRAIHFLMPSKLYGILASGTPLIAMAPRRSELARLVEGEQVGIATPPGDPQALADQILWFSQWCPDRDGYGQRARELAVARFDRRHSVRQFSTLLQNVAAGQDEVASRDTSSEVEYATASVEK